MAKRRVDEGQGMNHTAWKHRYDKHVKYVPELVTPREQIRRTIKAMKDHGMEVPPLRLDVPVGWKNYTGSYTREESK